MKLRSIMTLSVFMVLNYSCFQKQGNNTSIDKSKITPEIIDNNTLYLPLKTINIETLVGLLGKTFESLPDITGYKKEYVTIEDEEGMAERDGIKYFKNDNLVLLIESNGENKGLVDRITLCSDQIKDGELYIGQSIGNIKK